MEQIFIRKYLDSIPGIQTDRYGNKFKKIGSPDTMFTSHTDTVHPFNSHRQKVLVVDNYAYTNGRSVLGADDGTGVWLMLNMIHAKVPGLYVFQRHEEAGGVGSNYSAKRIRPSIKKVISLDRKGTTDIITHQGTRTCSDTFANALAKALGRNYRPSQWGTFTDSANYADKVPECTNISIGYYGGHTFQEKQDLKFAQWLAKKLTTINFKALPVSRDPSRREYPSWSTQWSYSDYKPKKTNSHFYW